MSTLALFAFFVLAGIVLIGAVILRKNARKGQFAEPSSLPPWPPNSNWRDLAELPTPVNTSNVHSAPLTNTSRPNSGVVVPEFMGEEISRKARRTGHSLGSVSSNGPFDSTIQIDSDRRKLLGIEELRGLIIQSEPLEEILSGKKKWEMRTRRTKIRGPIALIKKGSGKIYGLADIVDSLGPLSDSDMAKNIDKHGIVLSRLSDSSVITWRHAWVLQNVRRLTRPVPYAHPPGAVIFVLLNSETLDKLRAAL